MNLRRASLWVVEPWAGGGLPCLSSGERRRAAGMRSPAARATFERSRTVLRLVLAERLATSACAVPLIDDAWTVPRLRGSRLGIGLAHAGGTVAVAVSSDGRVGVDVERAARRPRPVPGVAYDESKLSAVVELTGPALAPLGVWVAQEAALKADGIGLGLPFGAVRVERCPGGVLVHLEDRGSWGVCLLPLPQGVVVAVAAAGQPPDVLLRQAVPRPSGRRPARSTPPQRPPLDRLAKPGLVR